MPVTRCLEINDGYGGLRKCLGVADSYPNLRLLPNLSMWIGMELIVSFIANNWLTIFAKTSAALIWKILQSISVPVYHWAKRPFDLSEYKREIENQIKKMPFIYKDIELNAVDDFVDVDMSVVDSVTLEKKTVNPQSTIVSGSGSKWWQFTENRKVILVGDAGIGKTTIFRHLVLSIISGDKSQSIYPITQRLVPVFVPLKAIDSNAASPILRYLQDTYRQFHGESGIRLLEVLARKRRLVIFLDGYDEIPYVGGTALIKAELEMMFGDRYSQRFESVKSEYGEIYQSIIGCRVLMSSRKDFFSTYRLNVGINTRFIATAGVESSQQPLVNKIFNRYKNNSPSIYDGKLDPELFLQRLRRTGEKEIFEISKNPLFLTALCFAYAHQVLLGKNPEETWRKGTYGLILECIDLLVLEIDQAKTAGLSDERKMALLNRRSAYPTQKKSFLSYQAAALYGLPGVSFTYDSLIASAKRYFSGEFVGEDCVEILNGLDSSQPTSNIVLQLIRSGVFVSFPASQTKYDFPHRRFKEVLAVEYYNSEDGCKLLSEKCRDASFISLILFYAQNTAYWSSVCALVSIRACEDGFKSISSNLLIQLLGSSPSASEAKKIVSSSVDNLCAMSNVPNAGMPSSLMKYFDGSDARWLSEKVRNAIFSDDSWRMSIFAPILSRVDRVLFNEILVEYWGEKRISDAFALEVLEYTMRYGSAYDALFSSIADALIDEGLGALREQRILHQLVKISSISGSVEAKKMMHSVLKRKYQANSQYLDECFYDGSAVNADGQIFRVPEEVQQALVPRLQLAWGSA